MYVEADKRSIKTFKDLNAWQEAHNLVLAIYQTTDNFPAKENFALTGQMRRSAVSITSNIAEGFSRKTSKEKSQFFSMALGSLTELQSQTITANDVGYITKETYSQLDEQSIVVHKLINGLIRSCKTLPTYT